MYIYIYISYYIILYCHIGDERGTEHLKEMKMIISLRSGDSGVFQTDSVIPKPGHTALGLISSLLFPLSYGKSLGFLGQVLRNSNQYGTLYVGFSQCSCSAQHLRFPTLKSLGCEVEELVDVLFLAAECSL